MLIIHKGIVILHKYAYSISDYHLKYCILRRISKTRLQEGSKLFDLRKKTVAEISQTRTDNSRKYRKAHNANVLLKINELALNSGQKPLCAYHLTSF